MDSYSDIVLSSDFKGIKAFPGTESDEFGFMWLANGADCQETADRLRRRNERILNTEMDRLTEFNKQVADMKLEKERNRPKGK